MTPPEQNPWTHSHRFDTGNNAGEVKTRAVLWITLAMMVLEIAAGWGFHSMSLLADGFHMSSHAVAIGMTVFAYAAARRYAHDQRFAFGTWKIEILAGFASGLLLLGVAALMLAGSIERLLQPLDIQYAQATGIAVLGLMVNLVCAWLLGDAHHHDHHDHDHDHDHNSGFNAGEKAESTSGRRSHHQHQDLNLKSAYIHVLADAATSVLAIFALAGGWWMGWTWLDPVMGIVGALLVAIWAKGLLKQTGVVLLDREMDHPVVAEIQNAIADDWQRSGSRLTDLHVWRVGRASYSCAMTILTSDPDLTPQEVRRWLARHQEIAHVTVEIHWCEPRNSN